jgi:hypothetical protein
MFMLPEGRTTIQASHNLATQVSVQYVHNVLTTDEGLLRKDTLIAVVSV